MKKLSNSDIELFNLLKKVKLRERLRDLYDTAPNDVKRRYNQYTITEGKYVTLTAAGEDEFEKLNSKLNPKHKVLYVKQYDCSMMDNGNSNFKLLVFEYCNADKIKSKCVDFLCDIINKSDFLYIKQIKNNARVYRLPTDRFHISKPEDIESAVHVGNIIIEGNKFRIKPVYLFNVPKEYSNLSNYYVIKNGKETLQKELNKKYKNIDVQRIMLTPFNANDFFIISVYDKSQAVFLKLCDLSVSDYDLQNSRNASERFRLAGNSNNS